MRQGDSPGRCRAESSRVSLPLLSWTFLSSMEHLAQPFGAQRSLLWMKLALVQQTWLPAPLQPWAGHPEQQRLSSLDPEVPVGSFLSSTTLGILPGTPCPDSVPAFIFTHVAPHLGPPWTTLADYVGDQCLTSARPPTSTAVEHPASQAQTPVIDLIWLSVHPSLPSGPHTLPCKLLYGDNKYDFLNMILLRSQPCTQANLPFNT